MDVHPTKNVSIGIDPYPHNIIQDTFLRRPPQGSHLRLAMGIQPPLQLLQAVNARAVHASREDPRLLLLGCTVGESLWYLV